jgi:AraC-like DNA-binding protein
MKRSTIEDIPFVCVRVATPARHYRCPRDWTWRQRLNDFDLWLVLAGKGALVVNGVERGLEAPVATLLLPGDEVVGSHDPRAPLEVIALHFTPEIARWRRADAQRWGERLRCVPLRPVARFRELGEMLAAESTADDPLGAQMAPMVALALLGAVWRLAHGGVVEEGDDRVDALLRAVQREPAKEWTLAGMARQARMGTTRLNTRVRELTGFPPARWVIRCRLEQACILLAETELKLASIADACGYRDVYFFARQFRQAMGCPPGVWRRRKRGGKGIN